MEKTLNTGSLITFLRIEHKISTKVPWLLVPKEKKKVSLLFLIEPGTKEEQKYSPKVLMIEMKVKKEKKETIGQSSWKSLQGEAYFQSSE